MPDERLDLLQAAISQLSALIDEVGPDDLTRPTPCRSWTVAELIDHVVGDLTPFLAAAKGEKPDFSAAPPPIEGDRAAAFRDRAQVLLATWRDARDPGDGVSPRPFQDLQLAEFAAHGWDLAAALGRTADLDPRVADAGYAHVASQLKPEFRGTEAKGKAFGPEVTAPAGADPYARLAAFLGRDPEWRPGHPHP